MLDPLDQILTLIGDVLASAQAESLRCRQHEVGLTDFLVGIVTIPGVSAHLEKEGSTPELEALRRRRDLGPPQRDRGTLNRTARGELPVSSSLRSLLLDLSSTPNLSRSDLLLAALQKLSRAEEVISAISGLNLDSDRIAEALQSEEGAVREGKGVEGAWRARRRLGNFDLIVAFLRPLLESALDAAERSGQSEIDAADVVMAIARDPLVSANLRRAGVSATPISRPAASPVEIPMARSLMSLLQGISVELAEPSPDKIPWLFLRILERATESDPRAIAVLADLEIDVADLEGAIRAAFLLGRYKA